MNKYVQDVYKVEDCIQYCKTEQKCQAFNFKTTQQCQLLAKKSGKLLLFINQRKYEKLKKTKNNHKSEDLKFRRQGKQT